MRKWLKKYRYDISIGVIIIGSIVFFTFVKDDFGFLSSRESFQEFIRGFGAWAPIIIILIIIAEVIVAPVPGFIPITSAGFIFGVVEGSIYSLMGSVAGSIIVFFAARKFGRYLVLKLVEKERLERYEEAIKRRANLLLFFYFLPIFPTDIISVAFGLSDVKFKKFATFMSLGFALNVFILNYFGDYLAKIYFI